MLASTYAASLGGVLESSCTLPFPCAHGGACSWPLSAEVWKGTDSIAPGPERAPPCLRGHEAEWWSRPLRPSSSLHHPCPEVVHRRAPSVFRSVPSLQWSQQVVGQSCWMSVLMDLHRGYCSIPEQRGLQRDLWDSSNLPLSCSQVNLTSVE